MSTYSNNDWRYYSSDELYHHGILGQKWGIRRYQNPDGSLTEAGKKRYGSSQTKSLEKEFAKLDKDSKEYSYAMFDLQKRVENTSGDWYFGKAVSPGFKKVLDQYKNDKEKFETDPNGVYQEEERTRKSRNDYEDKVRKSYTDKFFDDNGYLKRQFQSDKGQKAVDEAYDKAREALERDPKYRQLEQTYRNAQSRCWKAELAMRKKMEDDLLTVVLQDLGYEDTPQAREILYDVVFWD